MTCKDKLTLIYNGTFLYWRLFAFICLSWFVFIPFYTLSQWPLWVTATLNKRIYTKVIGRLYITDKPVPLVASVDQRQVGKIDYIQLDQGRTEGNQRLLLKFSHRRWSIFFTLLLLFFSNTFLLYTKQYGYRYECMLNHVCCLFWGPVVLMVPLTFPVILLNPPFSGFVLYSNSFRESLKVHQQLPT